MQDIANERDLAPFMGFDDGPKAGLAAERETTAPGDGMDLGAAAQARRLVDRFGGFGWTAVGFLLGAIFWHFVGFWGFVAQVVLAENPAPRVAEQAQVLEVAERGQWVQTAEAAQAFAPACVTLYLDRATGRTTAIACDGRSEAAFTTDAHPGREDRAESSTVAPQSSGSSTAAN
jgi:hypothetical protein